ncbi:IS110 family transposase, partial [Paenibacillus thiaminolyticus]
MKYKQKMKMNQRIEQITESTLMVGADIAKDLHVARAIDFRAIEIGNECVFSNNNTGFEALLLWMKELQAIIGKTKAIL